MNRAAPVVVTGVTTMSIAARCVYTILHPGRLKEAAKLRGPSTFQVGQRWVSAQKLLQAARAGGENMAVLFGNALSCSRLIYWGLLEGIDVGTADTHYTVFPIRIP